MVRLALAGAAVSAIVIACNSERPMAASDGTSTPPSSSCVAPETGCACSEGSAPAACGRVESRTEDSVICAHGTMACTQGVWGPCVILDGPAKTTTHAITGGSLAMGGVSPQLFGATQPCGAANACNPACNMFADDPVGVVLEAGLQLLEGGLALAPPGDAGSDAGCTTTITGRVFDPGENVALAGISVFEPAAALTTLPTGIACDTCDSLQTPARASAVTVADGSFTLTGVTPGTGTSIVVQSGRWRRETTVNVTACTNNTYPAGTFRLPRSRTDGVSANIPNIAIVTGLNESLACLLRKIGISTSEFKGRGTTGTAPIELVKDSGMDTSPPSTGYNTLLGVAGEADAYSALLFDCTGSGATQGHVYTPTESANFADYLNRGGRAFIDHSPARELIAQTGLSATSTGFNPIGQQPPGNPASGFVRSGNAAQNLFRDWYTLQGPTYANWVIAAQPYTFVQGVSPGAGRVEWIAGKTDNAWGPGAPPANPTAASNYVLSYSVETPLGGSCNGTGGTGRLIYNGFHVSPNRSTDNRGAFPSNCTNDPLSEEELALEYQLFQLTACALGGPPPPPPPPNLVPQTFSREYRATCNVGECVAWKYFSWQSIVPPLTSITFEAQTAPDASGVPGTYGPNVPIGTANTTTLGWTWDSCTVDGHLRNLAAATPPIAGCTGVAPAQQSQEWLKVNMTFNPAGPIGPILTQWRQMYDCVPCE